MIKIGILNNHLSTFGGGEKNTYAMASCLSALGHQVDVLTFDPAVPTPDEIEAFFGSGHAGFGIRGLGAGCPPDQASRDARLTTVLRDYQVFINHSAWSSFVNPCPLGIYLVMFPLNPAGPFLRSYQHFLCISDFTRFYTRQLWGKDLATTLLYPCCDARITSAKSGSLEILTIGRFNWSAHQKNHGALVEAFAELCGGLPPGSRLILLGRQNDALPETAAQMQRLRDRCRDLPVVFEVNASEQRKRELLARASVFWHGTGIGLTEPGEAAQMEHFGIAVLEAMRAGAVPLCYDRGGPREIIEQGVSGFLYRDLEELKTYTLLLTLDQRLRERMAASAIERAERFSRRAFDQALSGFFQAAA